MICLIESLPGGQKVSDIARRWPLPTSESQTSAMKNDQLLNMAQSAFGRRAVNDGELDHHSGMPELIRPPRIL